MTEPLPDPIEDIRNGRIVFSKFYLENHATRAHYVPGRLPKQKLTRKGRVTTGYRDILMPTPALHKVQRLALRELAKAVNCAPSVAAHAYCVGRSILTMTRGLAEHEYGLGMDFADFFGTVTPTHVRTEVTRASRSSPAIQHILSVVTNWCFLEGSLPQGAASSPFLSNLAAKNFDRRMMGLVAKWRLNGVNRYAPIEYRRYSDDLAFASSYPRLFDIRFAVAKIAESEGFKIKHEKTRFMRPSSQKKFVGIVVNNGQAVPKLRRELWRQDMYRIARDTVKGITPPGMRLNLAGDLVPINRKNPENPTEVLTGQMSYLRTVNADQARRVEKSYKLALEALTVDASAWSEDLRRLA